jgi:hypothetical protein
MEIIEEKIKGCKYWEILERNLQKTTRSLILGSDFIFQLDNDPKHTTNATQKWFEDYVIDVLKCPSQSPDFDPMHPSGKS